MIVLADNDIILKLAQCDLLDVLPDMLGQKWTNVFISPTAKYQLLPKNRDRVLNKCGNEETLTRLAAFLDTTKILPKVKNTALLAQLDDVEGIDGGEKLLFAAAVETENPLLITGDRRALRALLEQQEKLPSLFSALQNSTVIFETALLLVMRLQGFAIVKQKLLGSPKLDGMLRLVIKSDMGESDFIECLCSYSKEVIPLLAFKQNLPPQIQK